MEVSLVKLLATHMETVGIPFIFHLSFFFGLPFIYFFYLPHSLSFLHFFFKDFIYLTERDTQ